MITMTRDYHGFKDIVRLLWMKSPNTMDDLEKSHGIIDHTW